MWAREYESLQIEASCLGAQPEKVSVCIASRHVHAWHQMCCLPYAYNHCTLQRSTSACINLRYTEVHDSD